MVRRKLAQVPAHRHDLRDETDQWGQVPRRWYRDQRGRITRPRQGPTQSPPIDVGGDEGLHERHVQHTQPQEGAERLPRPTHDELNGNRENGDRRQGLEKRGGPDLQEATLDYVDVAVRDQRTNGSIERKADGLAQPWDGDRGGQQQ